MAAIAKPNRTERSSGFIAPEPVQRFRLRILRVLGTLDGLLRKECFFS